MPSRRPVSERAPSLRPSRQAAGSSRRAAARPTTSSTTTTPGRLEHDEGPAARPALHGLHPEHGRRGRVPHPRAGGGLRRHGLALEPAGRRRSLRAGTEGRHGVDGDPGLGDWAAQLTKGGSAFVGNTGFGYGDTGSVAYSERLLANFASQLAKRSSTAGQALMYAKQQYFATLGAPGVYDGKALQEATFYGLPMYRMGATGGLGAPALPPPDPGGSTTVSKSSFDVAPQFSQTTTDRGRYWTADGRDPIATHFRPIQPRTDVDVTPTDGAVVHGALITALASSDVTNVNPVLSRPTIDLAAHEPEVGPDDVAFPATLQRVQDYAADDGRHVQLNLAAGQFISDPSDPSDLGTQRLFSRIAGDVLRSRSMDFDPPQIAKVEAVKASGKVTFDVTTPDTDVTGGLALYQDSAGTWHSLNLTMSDGHARGTGPLPGDAQAAGVAFVQLVDAAGNVGIETDKGSGIGLSPASEAGGNAPPLVADPLPGPDGTTQAPVNVRVTGDARATATISVDGSAFAPYEGPVVLETVGVHVVTARAPDGSISRLTIIIKADDAAPPVTTIALNPATANGDGGWYKTAVGVTVTASDADGTVAETRCALDPASVPPTFAALPAAACNLTSVPADGAHTIYAASIDANGNAETPVKKTLKIDGTAPSLNPVVTPNPVLLGATATAAPNATDATSGVASSSCDPVLTSTAGSRTVSCTATDNAGNTKAGSATYQVHYALSGLLGAIDGPPTVNTGKAGRTYSLRFALADAAGRAITALSAVRSVTFEKRSCDFGSQPSDAIETTATGGTSLRYDKATKQYVYNWATPGKGCYTLRITLDSGQTLLALFNLS